MQLTHTRASRLRRRIITTLMALAMSLSMVAASSQPAGAVEEAAVVCSYREGYLATANQGYAWSYTIVYQWTGTAWREQVRTGWIRGGTTVVAGLPIGRYYAVRTFGWNSYSGVVEFDPFYETESAVTSVRNDWYCAI